MNNGEEDWQENITFCLLRGAFANPSKIILETGSKQRHAKALQERVAALSSAMRSDTIGVQKGDRVLLLSDTSDFLLEAMLAVMHSGGIAVPINTRWSNQEIRGAVQRCQPKLIFCELAKMHLLEGQHDSYKTICLGTAEVSQTKPQPQQHEYPLSTEALISTNEGAPFGKGGAGSQDVAVIVFTSGTAGPAKGVCLTHAALSFQVQAKIRTHNYSSSDIYLHTASLAHVGGLVSWLAMLEVGACQVMMPKFNSADTFKLIDRHRVTAMIAVPAMIADLLQTNRAELPTIKTLLLGGGELHASLVDPLLRLMPNAKIWTAYGMTECASSLTTKRLHAGKQNTTLQGSLVGRPPPGISITIYSSTNLQDPKAVGSYTPGHVGEVITKGAHLMKGYWQDSAATQAALLPGGWFRTGDSGWIDKEGQLWLAGRLKDVIRSGSENVAASETERVLMQHPAVEAAAVVGLPHVRLGEQVAALVQLKSEDTGTAEQYSGHQGIKSKDLVKFCKASGLAGFKVPQIIILQKQPLPVNSSGKVVKHEVKQLLLERATPSSPQSRL